MTLMQASTADASRKSPVKAAVRDIYGPPDVVSIREIEQPEPKEDEVLIRVQAVSLNSSDWEFLTGSPAYIRAWGLKRPRVRVLGSDVAGTVVRVGRKVTKFRRGDEVFGDIMVNFGGLAEYACGKESALLKKPADLSFLQVAAIPQAGLVALQGLRDGGKVAAGDRVLINGAGGGSGSYAVQLAKLWGAHVTGVDRSDKLQFMRQLGADEVIDYTTQDFVAAGTHYDVILDLVGRRTLFELKHVLAPGGRYCLLGGTIRTICAAAFLGPVLSLFSSKKLGMVVVKPNSRDMEVLLELIREEKIRPVVDKTYGFEDVRSALSYLGAANTCGKVVVTV